VSSRPLTDYETGNEVAWCPGCGNFAVRQALQSALAELDLAPEQVVMVSGIGQAAKTGQYIRCNLFDVLHGRTLPCAAGVKLANHRLTVIAEAGDGDIYSEGTNHLMHAMRRNIAVTCLVHNNQVYGLTRGQFSPTSDAGYPSGTSPQGSDLPAFNPLALAIAMDCSFVARAFAGDPEQLKETLKQAIRHDGFSLVDILQPCVTFNKVNTFKWYKSRVYYVDARHDPRDRFLAFNLSLEWGERIPCGIIYRAERPSLHRQFPQLNLGPLVEQATAPELVREMLDRFR
jgi:2-oxoglutarate ferredoxin oxidoreductase subunit beta